jgi:flavin-binding protein dodecin
LHLLAHARRRALLAAPGWGPMTELIGTSDKSIEDAVNGAVARANKTVRNMRWLEVKEVRGHIENGVVTEWQVIMRIGFTLED